jgi:hypothetical protein
MSDNIGDMFDMGEPEVPPASLELLQKELKHATELEALVEQMEEDLKNTKKALHHSKTARIPDMMNELAIPKITYGGYNVSVNDFVSGSLPNEDNPVAREAAIDYLVEHDAGSLIKTEVKAEFGRGGHNEALALKAELEEQGYATTMKTGVHAMTLAAWARERLKNGDEINTEVLGLFTGKVAKFTKVKTK